jgi:glycosyltransferase involved in cell wall biosynthesis
VASAFGLASPGKGLETAITAVAELAAEVPGLHYVIAGAAHSEIVRQDGEGYRYRMHRPADDIGIADRIHFRDAFPSDAEIAAALAASTVIASVRRRSRPGSRGAGGPGAATPVSQGSECPFAASGGPVGRGWPVELRIRGHRTFERSAFLPSGFRVGVCPDT